MNKGTNEEKDVPINENLYCQIGCRFYETQDKIAFERHIFGKGCTVKSLRSQWDREFKDCKIKFTVG